MPVLRHRFKIKEKGRKEEIMITREKRSRRARREKENVNRYIVKEVVKYHQ